MSWDAPHILLLSESYHLENLGDVAMAQVAVARWSELFPGCTIYLHANQPERAARLFPTVKTVGMPGRDAWDAVHDMVGFAMRRLPGSRAAPGGGATTLDDKLYRVFPGISRSVMRRRSVGRGLDPRPMEEFLDVLDRCDLVVVRGIGQITEAFLDSASRLLRTLRQAQGLGKPTAMTGQGLGPINHPGLRDLARQVLPRVGLIGLREGRVGPELLKSLGTPADRMMVTGDDAIEPAYKLTPAALGNGLGVNMRVAEYSGVATGDEAAVRSVLHAFARHHGAPLIPVPISRNEKENDFGTIGRLIEGAPVAAAGWTQVDDPWEVAKLAGRCRVVVTGSYHAGVFALSQGVSVVGAGQVGLLPR